MAAFAKTLASLSPYWVILGFVVILAALFLLFRANAKTRPFCGQLLVLSAICLMAALFFILTFSFKVSKMATGASAATMPRAWVVCLIPVAILCFVSILGKSGVPDAPFGANWKRVIIVIVAIFVDVFLFKYIGYYVSSAVFLIFLMLLMGERRLACLAAVPVGWCVFTYFVFAKFLFISLPTGSLWASIF
ncbi:MAG: tripartite tricarboxylate transporter TctB family protein [Clostridiales bacterium]|nr:tripartite tricarboxylate transporter TctB family protein [Clostridiales bacterium]